MFEEVKPLRVSKDIGQADVEPGQNTELSGRADTADTPVVGILLAALLSEGQQHTGEAVVRLGQGLGLCFGLAFLCMQAVFAWRCSQLHKVQLGGLGHSLYQGVNLSVTAEAHGCQQMQGNTPLSKH